VLPGGVKAEASADLQLDTMIAGSSTASTPGLWFGGVGKGKGKGDREPMSCYNCGGDHMARDCPMDSRSARRQHDGLGLDAKVETTQMDFSKLSSGNATNASVKVAKNLVEHLMTPENRQVLVEETGSDIQWEPADATVVVTGSAEQVKKTQRLLARVTTHCKWGVAEGKVRRLLKPRKAESVLCRLSPMHNLKPVEKLMTPTQATLTIGKDKANDVVVKDVLMSRHHTVLQFDVERGAVYILDCSTNGTFLNRVRLPSQKAGKVLLSHGDELLLKDPAGGEQEFGYIVNLNELSVKEEVKLEAPRRMLTSDEMGTFGRDFA